jgi:hypothetical protein
MHTGWVFGHSPHVVPLWGVKELPDEGGYGHVFNALQNALEDLLTEHRPARVGIEDIISQRMNSAYTARLTAGLHAIADLVCYQNDIKPERVGVDRIRSAVIGRCRLTALERAVQPKLTVKNVIVEPWCRAHGWGEIASHDARDAAVGFAYLTGIRSGKSNAKTIRG